MVLVTFAARDYELRPGESVLEGMARHGVNLPSACQAGACHTCLLRAVAGDPGEEAQLGLKPTLRARGYFLACLARPATDLTVAPAGADAVTPAVLARRQQLAPDVVSVWLRPERPVSFRAGQHVTLTRPSGVVRTYSIANLPADARRDGLRFHVRVYPQGAMSAWLARVRPGARIGIGTPAGDCFYLPGAPQRGLLLAGAGTGIAPLLAIARDARRHGHRGPITLIHGGAWPDRLYLPEVEILDALSSEPPASGEPPASREPPASGEQPTAVGTGHAATGHADTGHAGTGHAGTGHAGTGHAGTGHAGTGHAGTGHAGTGHAATGHGRAAAIRWRTAVRSRGEELADVVRAELAALAGQPAAAYLCGSRASVASMRRALFLAGMSLQDIHADEFVPAANPFAAPLTPR